MKAENINLKATPGLLVRPAITHDLPAILSVERAAFGREAEAQLAAALMDSGHAVCNLVALLNQYIVGHVLFSQVQAPTGARLVGLGPLAVAPSAQQLGIGMSMVYYAWPMLRDAGFDGVVVLGNPAYYRRFGFLPAGNFGLHCADEVPPCAFMACPLADGALAAVSPGPVTYAAEFQRV